MAISNLSPVYNVCPLNSPMPIRFTYVLLRYLSILVFMSRPSLHIHTPPLFQVELEKYGWECFGVSVPRTVDYQTIDLNLC